MPMNAQALGLALEIISRKKNSSVTRFKKHPRVFVDQDPSSC